MPALRLPALRLHAAGRTAAAPHSNVVKQQARAYNGYRVAYRSPYASVTINRGMDPMRVLYGVIGEGASQDHPSLGHDTGCSLERLMLHAGSVLVRYAVAGTSRASCSGAKGLFKITTFTRSQSKWQALLDLPTRLPRH